MVVVTSKSHIGAENSTKAHDSQEIFYEISGSDDVTHGKPDPEPVQLALETLKVDASEAIFIGDSPHDMEAGAAANVFSVGVTWGPYSREKNSSGRCITYRGILHRASNIGRITYSTLSIVIIPSPACGKI